MRYWLAGLRFTAYALVVLILLFAVLVSAGRALFPLVGDVAEPLRQQVSERLGFGVQFTELRGEWRGLSPELKVTDLHFVDPVTSAPFFQASSLRVRWHLLTSLISFKPALDVSLGGADLTLVQTEGSLSWLGMPPRPPGKQAANRDWLDTWLTHANLAADNSRIRVRGVWRNEVTLDEFAFHYRVRYGRARLSGQLRLTGEQEARVRLVANWQGRFADLGSLSGQSYLKVDAANVAEWWPLAWQPADPPTLSTGDGHVEVWATFHNGQLRRATGLLQLGAVEVAHRAQAQHAGFQSLQATLNWQSFGSRHWSLQVSDLAMQTTDSLWLPEKMLMECWHQDDGQHCQAALDRFDLKPWLELTRAMLAPDSRTVGLLEKLSPTGQLSNLHAHWRASRNQPLQYRVYGQLQHYSQQPHELIPGVQDVALDFQVHDQGGVIDVVPQSTRLDYPALFREPLDVRQLAGQLRWQRAADHWRLESSVMQLAAVDGGGVCQLSVDLPDDPQRSPYLRLQATLYDVDAARTAHYLPAGILPNSLVHWLDGAVIDGRLLRGDLIFHGPVRWRDSVEPLQYLLGFQVDQARFAFQPDWRPVDNAAADVLVEQGDVDVSVLEGDYYGTQISTGRVTWHKPGSEGETPLQVRVRTQGDLAQAFSVLRDSPIRKVVGEELDVLSLTGQVDVQLAIDAYLASPRPVAVSLLADVVDAGLQLPEQRIRVTGLHGQVGYDDQRGLYSPGLDGFFLDGGFRATLATRQVQPGQRETLINARGRLTAGALASWSAQDWLRVASGPLNYRLALTLRPGSANLPDAQWRGHRLDLETDLTGVQIALPPPLGKPATARQPLQIKTWLGKATQDWQVTAPGIGSLALRLREGQPRRGELVLGEAPAAQLPEEPLFRVVGNLPRLHARAWWQHASAAGEAATGTRSAVDSQTVSDSPAAISLEPWASLLDQVQVQIGDLRFGAQAFGAAQLNLDRQADAWRLTLRGDWVDADAHVPYALLPALQDGRDFTRADPSLHLNIRHLAVTLPEPAAPAPEAMTVTEAAIAQLNPARLPPAYLRLDELRVNDEPFGRWHLQLIPTVQGVLVADADIGFRELVFRGQGEWLQSAAGVRTSMRGTATTTDVAKVLSAWGYEPSLASETAELQLQASWPGAPYDLNLLHTTATARLQLRDGHFYRISSGAADKVLGVLNVDSWLNRLRLQFRDLSSDEMTYSEVQARADLADGVLNLQQLQLESPAMRMAMQGDINLADGLLDLGMAVTVPVTRNLVLPAAAVGGLPAAATVFVIERVLGSQLDKLTTMQYHVSGPLREPVVTLKDSFNIIPKPLQETLVTEPKPAATETPPEDLNAPVSPAPAPIINPAAPAATP